MIARRQVQGVSVPGFLYGTAWKEDRTAELALLALMSGFAGLDTANQRKHYYEAGVGLAIAESGLARNDLFVQTKFTYQRGQDHRLPYDPGADLATQVDQSLASSLEHLGVDYLDSYVLHGPELRHGITAGDWQVWRQMEALHRAGKTRLLGVSNISRSQLEELCDGADVQPAMVQNRCYAATGWDRDVRELCAARGMLYQGFSLLTANRHQLERPEVEAIAARLGATVPQVVFRFAIEVGMVPLTGTSSPRHMADDLTCGELSLTADDVRLLEDIGP